MHPILQEWHELDTGRKALRSFGFVVGGVFVGIALFMLWRKAWLPGTAVYLLGGVGGMLSLLGGIAPMLLRPVYRVWMLLAVVLGFVMTRVLLTLVFVLAILPIGLLRRLAGADDMRRRPAATYWLPYLSAPPSKERLEKYY